MQSNGYKPWSHGPVLVAVWLAALGCSSGEGPSSQAAGDPVALPDAATQVSTRGVGPYQIGISTESDILGHSETEWEMERKSLAEQGLHLEFDEGQVLTAITFMSEQYRFENGLSVGVDRQAVIHQMGEPLNANRTIKNSKLELDILVYPDISFLMGEPGQVVAIRIGKPG